MSSEPITEDRGNGSYPPADHVLRDIGLEVEVLGASANRGRIDAGRTLPGLHDQQGSDHVRPVPFGVVSTAVDVLAGALCARAIAPDWMATSVLTMQLGTVQSDRDLDLRAELLRAGRSTVTVEVALSHPADDVGATEQLGSAMLTFSRLERRASTLVLPESGGTAGDRYRFDRAAGAVDRWAGGSELSDAGLGPEPIDFEELVGAVVTDMTSGRIECEITPYIRNSFGAVNGGVVAAAAAASARALVRADSGTDHSVVGLTVNYLGQGRVGPVVTTARIVRADPGSTTVRVEVLDEGQVDGSGAARIMAVAHVAVSPFGPTEAQRV